MTISMGMPSLRAGAVERPRGSALPGRPQTSALVDSFAREATDLRISLTDRCNLRCTYCMPAEGLPFMPPNELMSREEIARMVKIGVERLGVRQVRFTGGEPLLRRDLAGIIADCAALPDRPEISVTTNAIGLAARVDGLVAAGLDRLNISLDTICAETFEKVTRRPFLDKVLAGIDAAAAAGITPIKINAVLIPGVNDHQAGELLDWALTGGYQLRFIEQMPLDADRGWERDTMITAAQIRERLESDFVLVPDEEPRDGAPAELWQVFDRVDGADRAIGDSEASGETGARGASRGTVGIIASVTEPFCADCRRTRLTGEGKVRSCLFSHEEYDLLDALRAGADDEEIADLWRGAMWLKPKGHGMDSPLFSQPRRTMSAIGG